MTPTPLNPSLPLDLIAKRRETVFLIVAGLFLGTLGILNILGVSRFVDLSITVGSWTLPMIIPLGVLPYPITFLCTDIISEFYGKKRANFVVWVGFLINLWILFILWIGGILPPKVTLLSNYLPEITHPDYAFYKIRLFTIGGIAASMIAYLVAQLLDVHLFHFWKRITKGKHLWLRNNGSTLISQWVDTVIVISIAFFYTQALPYDPNISPFSQLFKFILSCYIFKLIVALLDTIPFYLTVFFLRRYFYLSPNEYFNEQYITQPLKV